jgi:voltage-gated potassium channel
MPPPDLTPVKRRRLLARALLRAFATTVGLVALYYLLPLDNLSSTGSEVVLGAGLLGVIVLIGWQVRAITTADYPAIRGVQALAMIAPLFLLLFASAYYLIERSTPSSFTQQMSRTDSLYFTVTTFATVGYGDITAKSESARVLVIFQMLADLALLGFGVKVILGAVQMGRQLRAGNGDGGGSASAPSLLSQTDGPILSTGEGQAGRHHDE